MAGVLIILSILINDLLATDGYSKSGSDWTGLCVATNSTRQSPIDIEDFKGSCDNSIVLDMNLSSTSTAMTVEDVAVPGYRHLTPNPTTGSLGTLYATNLNGKIYGYDLKSVAAHSPSEHKIEGDSYDLEIQFIFELKPEFTGVTSNRAHVAILYTTSTSGVASPFVALFNTTGNSNNDLNKLVNASLPNPLVYFAYEGSLTIPDCSETVNWYVLEKALPISKAQLDFFTKLWAGDQSFAEGKGNNREVKERNNRKLKKGGVQCEEQFIYFFSFVLLYAFINYFIFK